MLQNWEKQHPGRVENIFRSIQNVAPSQLADQQLFDFKGLEQFRLEPKGDEDSSYDDKTFPALARM